MKTDEWLKAATTQLEKAGIGTARLDTLVLLEDVTGKDRAWLLANPEAEISDAEHRKLTKLLNQRTEHIPLAYVRGTTEFYKRNFVINPSVLEPRPESETMIDLLKELVKRGEFGQKTLKIADVGTGSGALGITAQLELGGSKKALIDLLELDRKALKTAQINVEKHTTNIRVIQSDLLDATDEAYDILLCNLPYVPDSHTINSSAMHEPKIAIFGGEDGLDLYRQLFEQVQKRKAQPLYILTESLPPQHWALAEIAAKHDYELEQTDDFIQVFRHKG